MKRDERRMKSFPQESQTKLMPKRERPPKHQNFYSDCLPRTKPSLNNFGDLPVEVLQDIAGIGARIFKLGVPQLTPEMIASFVRPSGLLKPEDGNPCQ
jgi:hypothetical protein